MEKIRLGNDIDIRWSLLDQDGSPYVVEGRAVSVEVVVADKKRVRIKEVELDGNTVHFVYRGKDQKVTGRCDLKFIENDGNVEMVTFDTRGAFEMVAHSWLIGGEPENERVQLSFVTVVSELYERVGPPGPKGETGNGIESVEQIQTSLEDSGENIVRVTMTDGTASDFSVRNGSKGSKGDTPVLTADEDGTIYADGVLLTDVVKDVTETVMANEESRQLTESARVSAEQARADAERARAISETERATAESVRASAEESRSLAETDRRSTEQARGAAEQGRVTAETARVEAENARALAEDDRITSEQDRYSEELIRRGQEAERINAETARQAAETERASAETARQTAEISRNTAEQGRADAESARATAEQGRVSAESGRVSAESARVAAETARESASATAVQNAETATADANTAAEHAEEAAATIDDKIAGKADESEVSQLRQEFIKVTATDEPYALKDYTSIPFVITSTDTWAAVNTSTGCRYRAVRAGQKVTITANATRATQWAFLAAEPSNIAAGDTAVFADTTGLRAISAGDTEEAIAPVDCYLYVRYRTAALNANYFPASIIITTYTTENKIEEWDKVAKATKISVLFIGNSVQADVVAYLPLLLKEYGDVRFSLYNWYIGGATMAEHLAAFNNGTKCDIFSEWHDTDNAWTSSQKTIQEVLSSCDFDVVCLQDYFNNLNYSDDYDLSPLQNVMSFIRENYVKAVDFITLFHAARRGSLTQMNRIYSVELECVKKIIQQTDIRSVVPAGVAINLAIANETIGSLGRYGRLTYDGVHAQEGLPCMIQTYVLAMSIFDKYGLPLGVQGSKTRITSDDQVTEYNIPNPHGEPVGMTDENCAIAQSIAVEAYKAGLAMFPFISENGIPIVSTNNLYNYKNALGNAVIGADGVVTGRNDNIYWITGRIPVDPNICEYVIINLTPTRVCVYAADDSMVAIYTGTAVRRFSIAGGTYIIAAFNTFDAFEYYSKRLLVCYDNSSDNFRQHDAIDGGNLQITDKQYFTIDDILDFATNRKENLFTDSFSLTLYKGYEGNKNMIITANAFFSQESGITEVPTVKFVYLLHNDTFYESPEYEIGSKEYYTEKQWRIPPFPKFARLQVIVTIPEGTSLYIRNMENSYSCAINRNVSSYTLNAHGATQSIERMNLMARVGYPACITIPKRTSDGVWVCFHDEVIGSQLKDDNGNTPAQNHPELVDVGISDLTYEELQTYSFAADYLNNKEKVAKVEDFFKICARTGMEPVFSVHPVPSESGYEELKALAIKWNVLSQLSLKPVVDGNDFAVLERVFGNEIKGMYLQVGSWAASTGIAALQQYNVDRTKVKVGVTFNLVSRADLTAADVKPYIDEGYTVVLYKPRFSGQEFDYWMNAGVHDFTESSNYSYGLNW